MDEIEPIKNGNEHLPESSPLKSQGNGADVVKSEEIEIQEPKEQKDSPIKSEAANGSNRDATPSQASLHKGEKQIKVLDFSRSVFHLKFYSFSLTKYILVVCPNTLVRRICRLALVKSGTF